MIFGAGESWYAKPDAGALLVSPADEDPQEPHDAWPDDMVLAEGLARYEAHVTEPVTRLLVLLGRAADLCPRPARWCWARTRPSPASSGRRARAATASRPRPPPAGWWPTWCGGRPPGLDPAAVARAARPTGCARGPPAARHRRPRENSVPANVAQR